MLFEQVEFHDKKSRYTSCMFGTLCVLTLIFLAYTRDLITDIFNDLNLQLKKNDLKKIPVDLIGGSRPALFLINSW